MPEPPRLWRFQIHLSTTIVLTFVVAGIMRWNFAPIWLYQRENPQSGLNVAFYGWPFESIGVSHDAFGSRRTFVFGAEFSVDVAVALLILFAVWFLCELLIRRRAARNEA